MPANDGVLWGRATSTNVQKVLWLGHELGLQFQHHTVGGKFGGVDTPEFAALNPNQTVPVYKGKDGVIWESHAILRHLARVHSAPLYGETEAERASVDQWLDWYACVFWPPVRGLFVEVLINKTHSWTSDEAQAFHHKTSHALRIAEAEITAKGFLALPRFSLADICLGIGLNRLTRMPFPVEISPALLGWMTQIQTRPAFIFATKTEPEVPGYYRAAHRP